MPNQPAPENSRIKYLEKLIRTGRAATVNNPRDLLPQEVAKYKRELAALKLQRDQGVESRRHATAEADRVIGAMEAVAASHADELRSSAAAVVQHVDGRFDGLDARLDRVLGTPGSVEECDQQMLQLRQEKKRRAKEEREAARAAEKKRKLEEPYRVDRQEGDVEVAGVVLRGEGVACAQGRQVDAELVIHGVRCKAVFLGSPSTLQLVGLS